MSGSVSEWTCADKERAKRGLGMGIGNGDCERGLGMGSGNGNWEWELGMRIGNANGNWEWELGMGIGNGTVPSPSVFPPFPPPVSAVSAPSTPPVSAVSTPCFRCFRPPPTGFRYQVAKGQAVKTQAAKEGKSFTIPVKDFTGVWSVQHEDNEEAEPEEVQASGYALPFIRGGKGVARTQ